VFAAAVTELFLLDPTAGLLHRGESELDHVECVEHGGRVFELVADGVGVAAERIQRCHPDPGSERLTAGGQPVGVCPSRAARHEIEQSCLRSTVAPGEVHNPGEFLRSLPGTGSVVPDVLIDAERVDAGEPTGVVGQFGEQRGDGVPHGVPVHPESACHGRHRGSVALDAADRPPRRPGRQFRPRSSQQMILAEPADRAGRLNTAVATLSPHQLHRGAERWDVMQSAEASPVPHRNHPTARAARLGRVGLHQQPEPRRTPLGGLAPGHVEHVHARQVEQGVDARAVAAR
jgi:hypothetical protein